MEAGSYGRSPSAGRRLSTETKQAFKTTEFVAYVVVLIALLIAGAVADGGDDVASSDGGGFGADKVWLYATLLTIGYMIARGLAKAGSRDPYSEQAHSGGQEGFGDRVRAAAQVIKEGPESTHSSHGRESETQTRRL